MSFILFLINTALYLYLEKRVNTIRIFPASFMSLFLNRLPILKILISDS